MSPLRSPTGRLGVVLLLAVATALGTVAAVAQPLRLQILHASDLEGGVGAIDDAPGFAAVVDALERDAASRGIASILLSAGDNYLLGPFFGAAGDRSLRERLRETLGQPQAREGVGRVDISIMNALGFDASALGNHEFDPGTGVIASIIGADIRDSDRDGTLDQARWLGARFPYLSTNLDFRADRAMSRLYTPRILAAEDFVPPADDLAAAAATPRIARAVRVRRAGQDVAVIGATTPLLASISSPGATRVRGPGEGSDDMASLAAILQPVVDEIRVAGVDKIILVSHLQQLALERSLAGLLRGVDVIVAGGSDTLLADPTDPLRSGDTARGDYPVMERDADGNPVLVVSTDGQYSYVGRLVVEFDAAGVILPDSVDTNESGAFATDAAGVARLWPDADDAYAEGTKGAAVKALTAAVRDLVLSKDRRVLGRTDVFLEGRRAVVRTQETNLGSLIGDAMLATARSYEPEVALAVRNGGGIRAEIGVVDGRNGALLPPQANPDVGKLAGRVSQLDIQNTLRFNNALTLLTLTSAQILAVLEHAVAGSGPGRTPGQFPQVAGVAFSFDPARPAGARVRTAALLDELGGVRTVLVRDGTPVDAESRHRVVTLDFLAGGGDGYPFEGFIEADPTGVGRRDLKTETTGASGFAPEGTEQDALATYLSREHAIDAFKAPERPAAQDLRIQDLSRRADTVARLMSSRMTALSGATLARP